MLIGLWVCGFVCLGGCDEIRREKHENTSEKRFKKGQNGAELIKTTQMDKFLMFLGSILGQGGTKEDPNININWKQTKKYKRDDGKLKNALFERRHVFSPKTEGSTAA